MGLPKHLTTSDIEELGRELDDIRNEVMESRGDRDRAYILYLIRVQRVLALLGRFTMLISVGLLPLLGLPHASWLASAISSL